MYDSILVPTDGSAGTSRVLTHALELGERFDATLHGLYVIESHDHGLDPGRAARRVREALEARGERAVERIATRGANAGLETRTAMREGTPHEEIVDYVEANDIDLIVMGTHGRSGVDRVLLGSVTERVVRLAPVPVLTVDLAAEEPAVEGETAARTVAADALAGEGHDDAEVTDVYHEAGTWVVKAADGTAEYNVHIDAATGDAVVATLPE